MKEINKFGRSCATFGNLPSSYLASMTYEEQLLWLCEHIKDLEKFLDDILENKLNDYIELNFNNIMINTMYDSENETLVLYLSNESEE